MIPKQRYITGFIDIRKRIFYKNEIPSHDKNARNIIESENWFKEFTKDPNYKNSPSDFLIFRKNFAQIGCSGQRIILVCDDVYKNDTNDSTVLRAISKSLTTEQYSSISDYDICKIKR